MRILEYIKRAIEQYKEHKIRVDYTTLKPFDLYKINMESI